MAGYEISAVPHIYNVECPRHKSRMDALRNGLIGEKLWYCKECKRPYCLAPKALRMGTYNQQEIDNQLKEKQ